MKSEVFNEDCMTVMARYPDKYFDESVKWFEAHTSQISFFE